jgi:hypothetical protein
VTAPARACWCTRADAMWAAEEVMTAALAGLPLPTAAIDQLTPGRAAIVVGLCLRAGARMQDGDEQMFMQAVQDARHVDAGATGWWRQALDMQSDIRPGTPPARAGKFTNNKS